MNLVGQRVSAILRDRDVLSASLLRLLVLPVLTWALLELLPISNPLVVGVIVVIMAMPCAAVTSILAESYGGNTEFPSKSVFLSSLFCLVTIPLISLMLYNRARAAKKRAACPPYCLFAKRNDP